ncbi:MAG TPA: XVIPCD domain-containing protein [Luteimonas sp.]|nr:XVIPCD domain-containing protein [Luteimonas sp.]
MSNIDIRQSANRVASLIRDGEMEAAAALWRRQGEGERPVVREAIDRYVAASVQSELPLAGDAECAQMLQRLREAGGAPRFPTESELAGVAESQKFDIYASIVAVRGNALASESLSQGRRVILGLRQENSTLATADNPETIGVDESLVASGKGVYDDRIVVLWRDAGGARHVFEAKQANTEPTAQYDHHAGSDGSRPFADGSVERRRIARAEGFGEVSRRRKIEGEDADGDGMRDLGRLAEGTFTMVLGRHPNPIQRGEMDRALLPAPDEVVAGRREGRVQRDTNADGWFTAADAEGLQDLNASFKIHRGSRRSTDSAGCQTIQADEYTQFMDAVRGDPHQTRWQYILTSTTPGVFRNVTHDAPVAPGDRAGDAPAQGREGRVPRHEGDGGPARPGDAIAPGHPGARDPRDLRDPRDPRHPGHPDHADYRRTHELLREAGARNGIGFDEAGLQRAALGLMAQARRDPTVRRIDEVAFSGATQMHPAGHFVAAIHRPHGEREPAFAVRVKTQALLQRPVEEALRQLGDGERQAREQGLAVEPAAQLQREALVRTI